MRMSSRSAPPKYVRTIVARVRVVAIAEEMHAFVAVPDGNIEHGLKAEKIEEER